MVEALTIVLAVSVVRGPRTAIAGTIAGVAVLALIVGIFGPALGHIDLKPLQIAIGILLILFGMRWLKKAILRASGWIAMHDEAQIFQDEVNALGRQSDKQRFGIDLAAAATAFNGVLIEGIEVVFIVVAVGSTARKLAAATAGAGIALLAVVILGLALRTPLSKIPENALKMIVGVMLTSLGTLWTGEGMGIVWPLGDWAVIGMAGVFAVTTAVMIGMTKSARTAA